MNFISIDEEDKLNVKTVKAEISLCVRNNFISTLKIKANIKNSY